MDSALPRDRDWKSGNKQCTQRGNYGLDSSNCGCTWDSTTPSHLPMNDTNLSLELILNYMGARQTEIT